MLTIPPIAQLSRLISALTNGNMEEVEKEMAQLSEKETEIPELNELRNEIVNLARKYLEAKEFIINLSSGNLDVKAPRKNRFIDPFKELQANLRHMVWQTKEIANGNYSQNVDFLGDFSESFSAMVDALKEKKSLEEALKRSEKQYRDIFENSLEGIYQSSFDGKIQRINPTFAQLFGYDTPEEMINNIDNVADQLYYYPEDRQIMLNKLITDGFAKNFELRFKHRNGSMFWVSANSRVVRDFSGEPLYLEGSLVDITQRKQSEEFLRLSEARLKRAEIAARFGNWELHVDSGLMIASDGAKTIYGVDVNKSDYEVIKSLPLNEYRSKLDKALKQLIDDDIPYNIEFKIKAHNSGEIKDIHSQAVYDKDKKIVFGIIQDITLQKQNEEALKESEASLRELNATKDKFFSIIAHDLKSPFNSILGLSYFLEEQVKEKNYEGIEEFASLMRTSSELAYDLLKNLLEWSRSQTGRMEFLPEYFELVSLIDEAVRVSSNSANQKSITICQKLPANLLVFADRSMISTVLRNLITNAIKFTSPGGQIIISAERTKTEIRVMVSDTGVGIQKENLSKLFRIDENRSTLGTLNEKGTGLGLILCKEFIEKHKGRIWVESEQDNGSRFYFSIPKS